MAFSGCLVRLHPLLSHASSALPSQRRSPPAHSCIAPHHASAPHPLHFGRRNGLFWSLSTLFVSSPSPSFSVGLLSDEAHASLLLMPPATLNNSYFLVRSGESEFESIGVINTNPVDKTNMQSGLSANGRNQTMKAAMRLRELGACEASCWIWPSITQRAYQTAEAIAYLNNINRSRIVPEYSFLDARGLGAYEGQSLSVLSV